MSVFGATLMYIANNALRLSRHGRHTTQNERPTSALLGIFRRGSAPLLRRPIFIRTSGKCPPSRCGTANVFCAVEPKAGRHFTLASPNRSRSEFAKAVDLIARRYPDARTVHLVMNNLNIHCRKSLTDYFGIEYGSQVWNRLTVHYTPKHSSWLNEVEIGQTTSLWF